MTETLLHDLAYGADWENSKKRWKAFWRQDVLDRPVMRITAPRRAPIGPLLAEAAYTPRFEDAPELEFHDVGQMLRRTRHTVATIAYFGEALPVFDHKWSVAQALAWGCEPAYNAYAAWCHPLLLAPDSDASLYADEDGKGWRWLVDTARQAAAGARRNFFVRPDWGNHTGDILATLMGNYALMMMVADDPSRLKKRTREVTQSLNALYRVMYGVITNTGNEGTVNYVGCWSPERCICLDCDISCMLSIADFRELFLEPIVETMLEATHRVYHLDGPGALHHLPTLLDIQELHGIQWVPGAGKEPIAQWIPMLKTIQQAGKSLWISINANELALVLRELAPEGLCITIDAENEDEAQRLLEVARL
jgi:hypothetical protein